MATSMKDPRLVYRRYSKPAVRQRYHGSCLGGYRQFKLSLNQHDRNKLDEYFESVREIEKQIDRLNHYYETQQQSR